MSAAERQLQTEFPNDQVDRLLFALVSRMKFHFTPDGYEKARTKEQIAEYLECSIGHVDKLIKSKIITPRRLYDGADPRFFISDIKWK
jgi:hypothetical protein